MYDVVTVTAVLLWQLINKMTDDEALSLELEAQGSEPQVRNSRDIIMKRFYILSLTYLCSLRPSCLGMSWRETESLMETEEKQASRSATGPNWTLRWPRGIVGLVWVVVAVIT